MVKQICLLNKAEAIKCGDKRMRDDCDDFLALFHSSWADTVASSTLRMQKKEKINKAITLPYTDDLLKLTKFLNSEITKETNLMTSYQKLQKLVLTSLVLYNKRRPAEVADIMKSDYVLSLDSQEDRSEILESLSLEDRAAASRYGISYSTSKILLYLYVCLTGYTCSPALLLQLVVTKCHQISFTIIFVVVARMHAMEVKGKSTRSIRPVPVLIERVVKAAIDKLLVSRPAYSPKSDYLFAR